MWYATTVSVTDTLLVNRIVLIEKTGIGTIDLLAPRIENQEPNTDIRLIQADHQCAKESLYEMEDLTDVTVTPIQRTGQQLLIHDQGPRADLNPARPQSTRNPVGTTRIEKMIICKTFQWGGLFYRSKFSPSFLTFLL
jgi:hypothetical protein